MGIKLEGSLSESEVVPLKWEKVGVPIKVGGYAMLVGWETIDDLFDYVPKQKISYFKRPVEGVTEQHLLHHINLISLKITSIYLD